ncbi:MAG: hypothetical protein WBA09_03275, partial [Candidatus Acidiferrum sp.]
RSEPHKKRIRNPKKPWASKRGVSRAQRGREQGNRSHFVRTRLQNSLTVARLELINSATPVCARVLSAILRQIDPAKAITPATASVPATLRAQNCEYVPY